MNESKSRGGRAAAFFDLDRTLIDVNSAVLYARFERRAGRISAWQLLQTVANTLLYHLNLLDMQKAYAAAVAHYRGVPEQDIRERAQLFFAHEVKGRLQPGAQASLASHRRQGHPLVMLSSSTCYQAAIATQTWGLDDWIANRFETMEGRLSGTFCQPLCYGPGKVELATRWACEHRVDLQKSYFYSDSYSDLPMLQAVGFPVVVNPDPRLKKHALRSGWPLADWSRVSAEAFTPEAVKSSY